MELFHRESGHGRPIVMLHGIFGSSDNWLTHSKMLSENFRTFALDLRNHGQSPHADAFDYPSMVGDVIEFMEKHAISDPVIIGHSMGGKVAMNLALAEPAAVGKLIVVDIAPKAYDMEDYIYTKALNAVPIANITTRQQADESLASHIDEPDVRQFLLKNLQRRPEGGFKWKLNLPAITENILNVGLPLQYEGTFEKPTLFIKGSKSRYIKDEDVETIRRIFPAAQLEELDAGHWVPAEKPKEFVELVRRFAEA